MIVAHICRLMLVVSASTGESPLSRQRYMLSELTVTSRPCERVNYVWSLGLQDTRTVLSGRRMKLMLTDSGWRIHTRARGWPMLR